jgi:cytochrome c oxidase cbb3-type subunit IV
MIPGIITAFLLLLFLVGSVWVFSPRRKTEFDAAAQLPLGDDAPLAVDTNESKKNEETTR